MIETKTTSAELWLHLFLRAIKTIYGLLLCLTIIGCASDGREASQPAPAEGKASAASDAQLRDDIMEAVFRHMCQPAPVGNDLSRPVNRDHKVYFLSVSRTPSDPRPAFLKRLSDLSAPVKPISAGSWRGAFIHDATTGERGAAFYIERITLISDDKADVDAVVDPAGSGKSCGWFYRLNRKDGKWVVAEERWKWMS